MAKSPWETFVIRRKINIDAFKSFHGLTTKELFLKKLDEMGVEYPNNEFLDIVYPVPKVEEKIEELIENHAEENIILEEEILLPETSKTVNLKKKKSYNFNK
jgi:hypothetical protein